MRLLAPVMAFVVLVAGCASKSDPPVPKERQQVETLRALPFGAAQVDTVIAVLKQAGVSIDSEDTPVRVTRWQAGNLAAEAASGGGIQAEMLMGLAPVPPGVPPVPYLVAAWVKTYDSPGARFARELMSGREDMAFPSLVLTLFLADAVAGVPAPSKPQEQSMALAALPAAGPCTFAAGFIQHGIAAVAEAVKVNTSGGGLGGFLGKIWNTAVDLAAAAIKGLIETFTRPVIDLMASVFGVVAVISQVSSFMVKWRTDLSVQPSHNRFGVDSEIVTGDFKLTVQQDQLPIPGVVLDCAAAVGVDLRSAGSAAGSKVDWRESGAGLATRVSAENTLSTAKTASYKYQTSQESSELAKSPDTETLAFAVSASVHRNDVQKARELFTKLLLEQLPSAIRDVVNGLSKGVLNAADQHLRSLTDLTVSGRVYITYHVQAKKTPTPGNTAVGGGVRAKLPEDCPNQAVAAFGYGDVDKFAYGPTWSCAYVGGSSPVQLIVGISKGAFPTPPPDAVNPAMVSIAGTDAAWITGRNDTPLGPEWSVHIVIGDHTMTVAGGETKERIIEIATKVLSVRS